MMSPSAVHVIDMRDGRQGCRQNRIKAGRHTHHPSSKTSLAFRLKSKHEDCAHATAHAQVIFLLAIPI